MPAFAHFASDQQLTQEALDAAQLSGCRRCRQLTPQQVVQVLENLPQQLVLARVECERCGGEQLALLTA